MEKHPKIFFEGKRRTLEELEQLFYERDDVLFKGFSELEMCIFELENEYELIKDGITWNGDDEYFKSYKKVLKKQNTKELDNEIEDVKRFYKNIVEV